METPHPRAQVLGIAERLDGRRLEGVEAAGKNLLLRFEGGLTLRSHLRMNGRWRVQRRGEPEARDAVARPARGRARGAPVERARARAERRGRAPARARHPGGAPRPRRDGRAPAQSSDAPARGGAPAPGARRGHREHVGGRGALVVPALSVARGGGRLRTRSSRECSRRRTASWRTGSPGGGARGRPTGGRAVPAGAAASRSAHAARATRTARPTGARAASPTRVGSGRPRRRSRPRSTTPSPHAARPSGSAGARPPGSAPAHAARASCRSSRSCRTRGTSGDEPSGSRSSGTPRSRGADPAAR